MAHREQHDGPIGDSVLAIVAAFTSGLDVFKRLRERRRRRKSAKKPHRATPAHVEPSGDELQLSNSLRQSPVDIQRHYESNYAAVGERFAQGDAIAHASLTEVLLKLNSGLVAIIGAFLNHGKNDRHPDYKSLTNLSDASRAEAIDALGQLYQRLSQSHIVLDRIRPKCPSCGSHHHQDCASSQARQRGGNSSAKKLLGAKPKHRRSQTELVMVVRRPRNGSKHRSSSRSNSSTALSTKSQRSSTNTSAASSASTPVTSPLPSPDPLRPALPRSHSVSTNRSDPPSYAKATEGQTPARDGSVTRKPLKSPAATTPTPPLQRPGTWPHGPRPLRDSSQPITQPQPFQPSQKQQRQTPPPYHPARPPKFPVSTAALAELPGSAPTPSPKPAAHQRRAHQQQQQPPAPPAKPHHLQHHPAKQQPPQPPRPISKEQPTPSRTPVHHYMPDPSASAMNLNNHPAYRNNNDLAAMQNPPSLYSFSSDSTKLGEIPMRKWAVPFDYAAMERANAEAAARGNLPANGLQVPPGAVEGGRRRGLLGRILRRGSD
ncbi:hypothetical protein MPH_12350 [Macrophomina phaseolina MS6]|uniref:Uncharacterized protein n=1 Tax=Macrophomina phaseolina (strain MS6) TaxID=1126212 RepID=K2RC73_MACPH|nr:hypothetical protein MPH_12350 [Macrophomina phaseolina MS6]